MPRPVPLLRLSVVRHGDTAVVRLDGELDLSTADDLESLLVDLTTGPDAVRRLDIDAAALTFMDVAGVGPLVRARERLPASVPMRVRNAPRNVTRVVRLLQLETELGLVP